MNPIPHLLVRIAVCAVALVVLPAAAAEHRIRMLNYGQDGGMVFEPPVLKVAVGDVVEFVPEHSGHNVQSYALPEGATPWLSKVDEPYRVTIEKEGVYLYYCPPHLMNAMIGVVVAGQPANLDAVKARSARLKPKLVMKAERLDAYLEQAAR